MASNESTVMDLDEEKDTTNIDDSTVKGVLTRSAQGHCNNNGMIGKMRDLVVMAM